LLYVSSVYFVANGFEMYTSFAAFCELCSFMATVSNKMILKILNWFNRLFLLGLDKYGKGDWRSISRNFVVTRTPTQVASHAQKYFIRLNSMNKDRRRSSIHDITSVNNGDISTPQGPITGQTNGSAGNSASKSVKQVSPSTTGIPGAGIYAAPTIGQPVGGPLVSAVGTPVNLSAPPHMAYGIRAPVPGTVVPGAPMNMVPMTYPMPHTSGPHR
jgi:SHAQKYF class myb-like DNA-binding protein